ncbi:AAA family ATPase [Saccharopolyspora erythraea]|nr:AAA family ATPase [Saccharopolyspora erythraea]
MRLVADLVGALASGRSGMVCATGAPGVGRSAILDRATAAATAAGFVTAFSRCSPAETGVAFSAVTQLLYSVCPPGRAAELADACTSGEPSIEPLCGEFAAAAGRGPLVVAIDDLQWADAWSLRTVEAMVRHADRAPVLFALTAHGPLSRHVDVEAPFDVHELWLDPLTVEETAEFLTLIAGEEADPEFAEAAAEATGGHPAVLRRVVDLLAEHGRPTDPARRPEFLGFARSVRAERAHRIIGALPEHAAELLRVLAVCGEDFDFPTAATLTGLSAADRAEAVETLVTSGLVLPGPSPRLAEPRLAADILALGDPRERDLLRQRAAALGHRTGIPSRAVADLLCGAPSVGAAWAGTALATAAEEWTRQSARGRAVAAFRRALDEPLHPHERARVLVGLAALEVVDSPETSDSRLWQVLTGAQDERPPPSVLHAADMLVARGDNETAWHLISALRQRGSGFLPAGSVEALDALGWIVREEGPMEPEIPVVPPIAIEDDPADPARAGALAWRLAARGQDRERAQILAKTALSGGDGPLMPLIMASRALLCCLEPGDAFAGFNAVLAEARRRGSRALAAQALLHRAEAAVWLGQNERACNDLRAAADALPVRCWHPTLAVRHVGVEVAVHRLCGRMSRARQIAEADLPTGAQWGVSWAFLLCERGRLRLEAGEVEAALTALLECGRILRGRNWDNPMLSRWRALAATGHARLGDREAARRLVAEEKALSDTWRVSAKLDEMPEVSLAKLCSAPQFHDTSVLRSEPAPRPSEATDVLSEEERAVAGLAARGVTNREIAMQQSVAIRTVELRLTKVYRKLRIRGRAELAEFWARSGRGK